MDIEIQPLMLFFGIGLVLLVLVLILCSMCCIVRWCRGSSEQERNHSSSKRDRQMKQKDNATIAFHQVVMSDTRQTIGCFGEVRKAEAKLPQQTIQVAIKLLRHGSTDWETEEFNRVIDLTERVGKHPNIVCLLGLVKDPTRGDLLIIVEGVQEDLKCYLGRLKQQSMNWDYALPLKTLFQISCDVAKGMVYLTSTVVTHASLAAQTVLLDHYNTAKISGHVDFGKDPDSLQLLHRQVPLRWSAPEAFMFNENTYMSDVWSFGVLLWEIFSLGNIPYMEVSSKELYRKIREGYRLRQTRTIPNSIYPIMTQCWYEEAFKRPTFLELLTDIEDITTNILELDEGKEYEEIDQAQASKECSNYTLPQITETKGRKWWKKHRVKKSINGSKDYLHPIKSPPIVRLATDENVYHEDSASQSQF